MSSSPSDPREVLAISHNCAQASFAVLAERYDLDGATVLRALTPLPGLALRGEACGAVTGCLMAIGLAHGRDRLDDTRRQLASLALGREFCRQFEDLHGSTSCAAILESKLGRSFDLAGREEAREYAAAGGPEACGEVVAGAVELAGRIIERRGAPTDAGHEGSR